MSTQERRGGGIGAAKRGLLSALVLLALSAPSSSSQDGSGGLADVGGGGLRRGGRRLLTRDLNMQEIFLYWRRTHGHWSDELYGKHVADYQALVAAAGRSWGAMPASDEELLQVYYFLRNRTEVPHAPGWTPERDRCAPACRLHGTCNQEMGRCDCPRGRQGPDCSQPLATSCREWCQHEGQCWRLSREWCINQCNDRGSCVGGVCHCFPGYFGADCSLSIAWEGGGGGGGANANATVLLAGLNYVPNPRGPRIYFYEFPPQYHLWGILWVDRPLNIILWERLTSLGLRETDPAKADYFFLPGCGRGCNKWDEKFAYIMANYPQHWNRHGGRDHLMTHPGDWGRCEKSWGAAAAPFIANLTMLTHWGITVDRSKETEHELFNACHKPNQDIQMPVLCGDLYPQFEHGVWHPNRAFSPMEKKVLASVAGSICAWNSPDEPPCKNKFYSLGVRAALWELLRDRPGFHMAKRVAVLGASMAESEFCFAPTGAGHGKRQVMSVTLGCMPVVISDHVAQPFEPFLDWNDFGVWIPERHIRETEAILRGFTAEQKAAKMEKLRCAARHVAYTSVFGGLFAGDGGEYDAVATLVTILRARLAHPGLPDHQLMGADPDFADFMACMPPGGTAAEAARGLVVPRPPAPPFPSASSTSARSNSVDDGAFPHRTVTTGAWVRAANGEATAEGAAAEPARVAPRKPLCTFNSRWVYYADHTAPAPTADDIERARAPGQCMPKNANRPGGFFPGGSVLCPPMGPITQCERHV